MFLKIRLDRHMKMLTPLHAITYTYKNIVNVVCCAGNVDIFKGWYTNHTFKKAKYFIALMFSLVELHVGVY